MHKQHACTLTRTIINLKCMHACRIKNSNYIESYRHACTCNLCMDFRISSLTVSSAIIIYKEACRMHVTLKTLANKCSESTAIFSMCPITRSAWVHSMLLVAIHIGYYIRCMHCFRARVPRKLNKLDFTIYSKLCYVNPGVISISNMNRTTR